MSDNSTLPKTGLAVGGTITVAGLQFNTLFLLVGLALMLVISGAILIRLTFRRQKELARTGPSTEQQPALPNATG